MKIDNGKAFDCGRVSDDYAKFRDIYPNEFYKKIADRNLCVNNQRVLDLGTGTGVLPRNMYALGAKWTGTDISENQIKKAKELSAGMDIAYYAVSAENWILKIILLMLSRLANAFGKDGQQLYKI